MALMTRACWSENFVLVPGKYPKGWNSPYVSEREVIAVYSDYEPMPVQVIRLKNSGVGSDFGVGDNFALSKDMLQAYIAAHPPYQKGSKIDACLSQTKKKKNPANSWSEADLIQFLSGGGDVTVRDLKYSFGGTSQSHTKRLQELVGRGILYYDNGKYGLMEDQAYRSNPKHGDLAPPSREADLHNNFAVAFAQAFQDKTGIPQKSVSEGYWGSGVNLNFGPILDERYRSVSLEASFFGQRKIEGVAGFRLVMFRNTRDFEDGVVPWELDGQIRMAVLQEAFELFSQYGSVEEYEEEPRVSSVDVLFGSAKERSFFYEHMEEIARRLGEVAGQAAMEPIVL